MFVEPKDVYGVYVTFDVRVNRSTSGSSKRAVRGERVTIRNHVCKLREGNPRREGAGGFYDAVDHSFQAMARGEPRLFF